MENLRRYVSCSAFMLHWGTRIDFPAGPGCREKDGVAMVQQFRKSITALAFFLASGWVWAQGNQAPLALRPDAPDRYVVVRGDTLWGISQRYTDSPWRWPELWSMNKDQIRNPHLIYPGYVIILDREKARLSIAAGEAGAPAVTTSGATDTPAPVLPSGTVKLSPRVRAESL